MFNVGSFRAATCRGISRRSFLTIGASAPLALGLSSGLRAADPPGHARAKSVLFIWLWGAPSHLDTFDPKPDAPMEYRGPFGTIATRTPGVRFTDLFPQLAARSDRFTLVRSNVSSQPGHPDAGTVALTGFHERPEPVKPNFGSIVAKHRGHRGIFPPFVSVGRGVPRDAARHIEGYGGGTLGKTYDPFLVNCAEDGTVDIPSLDLLGGLTPNRLVDRRSLLTSLDATRSALDSGGIADWDRHYQRAYGLLNNPEARAAFDLTRESQETRDQYGYTTFGQSCLMARRLVEAQVPYVQLNWSEYVEAITPNCDFGWDTHIYNFELLQDRHGPLLDRTLPVLLDELEERGLLDTTLVVVMGEFGRTPKINQRAARDHWPRCYFSLWAGAGIEPGRTIGRSDKLGEDPVTTPITPLMVGTTIAELAGVNTQSRAEMKVLEGGTVIDGLV
jgi:uncharacterized protein (DUF1501 family)